MKLSNLFRILFLALVVTFIAPSCVKEGPMGQTGANGNNGADGANGKDANSACLTCHKTSVMDGMESQYRLSKHFLGTTSARNGKYCARCHTSEGFEEITGNGKYFVANDISIATRISCATCHKHSAFDFSGDTITYVLSTTAPVPLNYYEVSTATNFFNNSKTEDLGKINNLCTTCHQIRGATSISYLIKKKDGAADSTVSKPFDQLPFFPLDNTKDVNSPVKYQVGQSFSVHDGNQSNLFAGINGYEYPGKTYTRKWKHSDFSCTDCHMNEYNVTTKTGGHTLWVNEEACKACHAGADKITPIQVAIDAKRIELGEALTAKKIFKKTVNAATGAVSYGAVQSHDFYGALFPTETSTTKFGTALANVNTVDPKTAVIIYSNSVTMAVDKDFATRIGREWKYGELGAAYNYGYINSELSKGVHNPTYALQLLQNSIDYLKSY